MNTEAITALRESLLTLYRSGESEAALHSYVILIGRGVGTISAKTVEQMCLEICRNNPQGAAILKIRFQSSMKRFIGRTRTRRS